MKDLKDRVVVITGSDTGIGRESAFLCADEGARLVITYHQQAHDGEETARRCLDRGAADTLVFPLDVCSPESIERVLEQVKDRFGAIDVLVNNAGVITWKHLRDQSLQEIRQQIEVNLTGLITMTKLSLPLIRESVINISSGSGKHGFENLTAYCATKFGVRGFTQALAKETALKIFSVNPPLTKTRMSGYEGVPVEHVARYVVDTIKQADVIESGSDVDVPR
ncbi:MAG: SDR family NAD(P)-dependent oxidoreductase [Candidatus Omnitrophica bacterium]|nr:SDR family NAD(P)-dependent oxidoreductase [Candidatus Omnitrophota bacterium]